MGIFASRVRIQLFIDRFRLSVSVSSFEPVLRPGRFRTSSNSHTVGARGGRTIIPLAAGAGAQEDETILDYGY
jgi:hypothetical protein